MKTIKLLSLLALTLTLTQACSSDDETLDLNPLEQVDPTEEEEATDPVEEEMPEEEETPNRRNFQ